MKEPYSLPEDQRERVTRTEMHSLQWLLNDISSMSYAQEDLAKRLECVPAGMQRMRLATGQLRSLLRDLFGTIPEKQRRQIQNAAKDMEVRLVPKLTPRKVSLVLEEETAKEPTKKLLRMTCSSKILQKTKIRNEKKNLNADKHMGQ